MMHVAYLDKYAPLALKMTGGYVGFSSPSEFCENFLLTATAGFFYVTSTLATDPVLIFLFL